MIKSILILISILSLFQVKAQLTVDAGNDIVVCCCTDNDEKKVIQLGENLVVTGGIPPFNYSWSGKHYDFKFPGGNLTWIYASDILDDTTKSNPEIVTRRNLNEEWTTYYLKVEDNAGHKAYDSLQMIRSLIGVKTILIPPDTIMHGDSINLIGDPYFFSNFEPFTIYNITPSTGLADSTNIFGWAKPDTTTTYYLQATNSVGCKSSKIKYKKIVVVDTTAVSNEFIAQSKSNCYFSGGNLIIERKQTNTPFYLIITNLKGQIIHKKIHHQSRLILSDLKQKPNGLYIITLDDGKQKESFKLINHQ